MNCYRNINRKKVQFDFAVRTSEKCFYDDEIKKLGGKFFVVPKFNGKNPISYYRFWKKFLKEHPEYKIVHGTIGSCAALYLGAAKKEGRVAIAHSQNTNPPKLSLREIVWRFWSYPTRFIADYFFACSTQAGIDRFGKNTGFTVMHNSIDTSRFVYNVDARNKIREQYNIQDKFVIGHVGRFTYQKNHKFLIETFYEIHKEKKDSVLLLVGSGELEEEIKKQCEELGILDSVIFAGVHSNVNEFYSAFDYFIFPSIFEGLGIVIIEAQTSGLKCLCSTNVQKEVNVTGLVEFAELDKGAEYWKDIVLKNCEYEREDKSQEVKDAGYDIKKEVKWLEDFYLDKAKDK